MKLMTAIALFEAGYIFKERNASFVPHKALHNLKNMADSFGYSIVKRQNMARINKRVSEISYKTKEEAWQVIDALEDINVRYGSVSVSDAYEASHITVPYYTDQYYGWKDLNFAAPKMAVYGEWRISFPPVIELMEKRYPHPPRRTNYYGRYFEGES